MAAVLAVGGIVWWRGGGTRTVPDPPPFTPSEQQDQQIVEVIQTARAAAVAEPGNGAKRAALAMVLHGNDLLELAEQTYVQALALDPDQARWWYQLAKVQAARGALDEAMASLDRAESLEPAYAPIHWRRGYWLLDLGRLEEASAAFNRALSISPTEPAARVGLARSKLLAGRNEEAIAVLEPIVQDLPQVGYLHQLLASAYAPPAAFRKPRPSRPSRTACRPIGGTAGRMKSASIEPAIWPASSKPTSFRPRDGSTMPSRSSSGCANPIPKTRWPARSSVRRTSRIRISIAPADARTSDPPGRAELRGAPAPGQRLSTEERHVASADLHRPFTRGQPVIRPSVPAQGRSARSTPRMGGGGAGAGRRDSVRRRIAANARRPRHGAIPTRPAR